jgi:hypothetical protein
MEVDFMVHDVFNMTRPKWQFATEFDEAASVLQLALFEQQNLDRAEKMTETEDRSSMYDSEDDHCDDFMLDGEGDVDDESLSEEDDLEVSPNSKPPNLLVCSRIAGCHRIPPFR